MDLPSTAPAEHRADALRQAALRLTTQGKVYDLSLPYGRNSYRWPGHNPGEIMTFRTPEGVTRQRDLPFTTTEAGNTGHAHRHSGSGIGMATARWLVEQKNAMLIASDTSGLECLPPRPADSQAAGGSFNPVHVYLLVQQGVHVGAFHNLERLAANRVCEFAYVATTNAIRGTVAGTALPPLALRQAGSRRAAEGRRHPCVRDACVAPRESTPGNGAADLHQ